MNMKVVHISKTVKDLGVETRAAVAKSMVSRKTLAWGVVTFAKKFSANADALTVTTPLQRSRK